MRIRGQRGVSVFLGDVKETLGWNKKSGTDVMSRAAIEMP